jgi:curved DNA-binding protein CbpA
MTADPFRALGLPARPDLTDDDVRAAWRRVAAATHPDRADGGDPARFAAAAAAYTELRTRYGRGEAHADLAAGGRRRQRRPGPVPPGPAARTGPGAPSGQETAPSLAPTPGPATAPGRATARLASRIRRGRPALLALRVAIAAGVSAVAFAVAGAQPAAGGLAAGALTWLLLTARHDLMPPGS